MDDLGGEKVTMDVGLGLGVLQGVRSPSRPRGVIVPVAVTSDRCVTGVRPPFSLGMSSDILPSVLL